MHKGKVGPLSPDHREYIGDILTSSRHLLQLINDVLDLAKVESGKMEFRPEEVDLAQLTTEVRDILRGLAAKKHLRVEIDVDEDVRKVFVDAGRVKQILYNYLSNAIKFTPEGGRISYASRPRALHSSASTWRIPASGFLLSSWESCSSSFISSMPARRSDTREQVWGWPHQADRRGPWRPRGGAQHAGARQHLLRGPSPGDIAGRARQRSQDRP